jgi:predicted alpha/beta superfamily hydrolase
MPKPTFILPSRHTGTDYFIYVAAPGAGAGRGPWPAALFLDGDDQFRPAVAAYRALRRAKRIPPLLLIGVGYGASYTKPANRRGRDYTPTPHHYEPTSGGADAFLKFLTDELWPELSRRHRVREDIRGIGGHSLSSLFVLHALFRTPVFFTQHLASAPSIWWDDRSILRLAAKRRARRATLAAKLFLGLGTKDTESMAADLRLFEQQLAARPFRGLRVTSEKFPGRDHYNSLPVAFRAGLVVLFGTAAPAD